MKVYFISGIGADHRFFIHTRLPKGYEAVYLDYIPHQQKESLPAYARRLAEKIDPSVPFALVGLSLGGIMATEIAKIKQPDFTILIASVPLSSHLPRYYSFAKRLGLHRMMPGAFFKVLAAIKHIFSFKTWSDKRLILAVIWEGDSKFINWAVNAVLEWNNAILPPNLYHIHGTRDEVFPISLTRPTHRIEKGGHLLVMSKADRVSAIIQEILSPYDKQIS